MNGPDGKEEQECGSQAREGSRGSEPMGGVSQVSAGETREEMSPVKAGQGTK